MGKHLRNLPLPEAHLGGLAVGIVLQILFPWRLLPAAWMGHLFGWLFVGVGLFLIAWAVAATAGVDVREPSRLIVRGPYAYGRNPMYGAWTLLYVGIGLLVNTVWPLAVLPVVLLLTHLQVLREERHLDARFGDEYRRYRRRTRRYL